MKLFRLLFFFSGDKEKLWMFDDNNNAMPFLWELGTQFSCLR